MNFDGISINPDNVPKHVAIIMDGNRRWAEKNSVSVIQGHRKGLERVIETLEVCEEIGVKTLTLFAFSTENWKRSSKEVNDLLKLFKYFFNREFKKLTKKKVRVLHSGLKDPFAHEIQNIIDTMTFESKDNDKACLNLAINYSGRSEIIEGIKALVERHKIGEVNLDDFKEEDFNRFLFQPGLPDPDLLIRTSGEKRISNFLLWQIAYTELYFTDVLWPEFTKKDFLIAISEYQKRERRFGGRL